MKHVSEMTNAELADAVQELPARSPDLIALRNETAARLRRNYGYISNLDAGDNAAVRVYRDKRTCDNDLIRFIGWHTPAAPPEPAWTPPTAAEIRDGIERCAAAAAAKMVEPAPTDQELREATDAIDDARAKWMGDAIKALSSATVTPPKHAGTPVLSADGVVLHPGAPAYQTEECPAGLILHTGVVENVKAGSVILVNTDNGTRLVTWDAHSAYTDPHAALRNALEESK